ncbi:3-phosphoserine/phosphohydroxythreonine transaminase [Fluviicola sp.]|uniref:3-phosphoserine/phosphohydroxythreonine transaminase n=1 Tax=Fluviicola sp. TaxID=1917219 RepID=UPI00282D47D5|nr:3-phosphoserine/phosphohydroxythreonine transaminase [Fluviicola sp.]MDR0801963.1 3-phosphoserine/phosphohydroxythreonine transaminase [Fluviicola sp.]
MKKHNFGAGPCILPQNVFKQASQAVLDFNGLSILEISHRSKDYEAVMQEARDLVKKVLNISDAYEVLYLQGGATLGFTIAALNMMRSTKKAGYINTGTWASGAIKEAKKVGVDVNIFASSEDKNFSYIPKNLQIPTDVDYVHFTSNNTIFGTQFKEFPKTDLPLVCDMSSDIFSKEINVSDFDLIYAGAQKNLGPAGATLYIVKKEALGKSTSPFMPSYLDLKQHADKDSMYNTPPVFSVYVAMLNLRDLLANGGIPKMALKNKAKASLLYGEIDSNPLFRGTAAVEDRSEMNVNFLLTNEALKDEFDAAWKAAGIVGLNGHRSVGGYRASMYNALELDSTQVLVDVMNEFSKKHG